MTFLPHALRLAAGFEDVQASLSEIEGSLSTTRAGAYGGAARASIGSLVYNQPLGKQLHLGGREDPHSLSLSCATKRSHAPSFHTAPVPGTLSESESLSSTSAGVAKADSTAGSGLPVRGEAGMRASWGSKGGQRSVRCLNP